MTAPPEGAWTSLEDPGERAVVRGKRYEIWRRTWAAEIERWTLVQWDECVSEHAAAWIVRCRGHLPPGEAPPPPDLEAARLEARRAVARAEDLAARLAEAERDLEALRRSLALVESP